MQISIEKVLTRAQKTYAPIYARIRIMYIITCTQTHGSCLPHLLLLHLVVRFLCAWHAISKWAQVKWCVYYSILETRTKKRYTRHRELIRLSKPVQNIAASRRHIATKPNVTTCRRRSLASWVLSVLSPEKSRVHGTWPKCLIGLSLFLAVSVGRSCRRQRVWTPRACLCRERALWRCVWAPLPVWLEGGRWCSQHVPLLNAHTLILYICTYAPVANKQLNRVCICTHKQVKKGEAKNGSGGSMPRPRRVSAFPACIVCEQ